MQRTRGFAWFLLLVAGAVLSGLLAVRVPMVQWQSSLLDTLPQEADPYHKRYLASQKPNEQRFLLLFSGPEELQAPLQKLLTAQLTALTEHASGITPLSGQSSAQFLQVYAEHAGYWATPAALTLLQHDPQQLINNAQQRLQQPLPVWADIQQDPLLLGQTYVESLPEVFPGFQASGPLYQRRQGDVFQLLLPLTSTADALSQTAAEQVTQQVEQLIAQVQQQFPQVEVARSGLIFHASAAAAQAKSEMTWFGGLSVIVVLLLLLWVFRSLRQLFFAALTLALSSLAGITAVLWAFPHAHLLTLVFATTLIGLCIDYVFHASIGASHGRHSWRHVVPALLLGACTTIAGFLLLLGLPLPLMQQLGVFMAAALAVVLLVVLLTPQLGLAQSPKPQWQALHQTLENGYQRLSSRLRLSLLCIACFVPVATLAALYDTDDAVQQLASSPASLLAQEQHVRAQTSAYYDADVILLRGPDIAALYPIYGEINALLPQWQQQGILSRWQSWFDYVPTPQQLATTQAALEKLWQQPEGQAYLSWLGIDAPSYPPTSGGIAHHPLYPAFFNAQENDAAAVAIIRLADITDRAALKQALQHWPQAELFNPLTQASDSLALYRQQLALWLLGLLALAWLLLTWRLPAEKLQQRALISTQIIVIIISAIACAFSVALLSQALNLFHLIGAMLVVVLGIDYGVFCASPIQRAHALQAISISALTTMVAFGALSFSSTPAIAAFGTTVLVGVGVTALLAPVLSTAYFKGHS
ncbi:RND transporter [Pseudidiomarina sediminum]|uniref:RND transporter n=1 Tax=Pseudidiomarina sediminum TaxID=431675 RepID=A0A432Z2B4_9GAMM|nr:MMPL family transporter [Pseudidiomarina sediminum]RUO72021.1 RND transporter [Pseudidiomarina sediminum]